MWARVEVDSNTSKGGVAYWLEEQIKVSSKWTSRPRDDRKYHVRMFSLDLDQGEMEGMCNGVGICSGHEKSNNGMTKSRSFKLVTSTIV